MKAIEPYSSAWYCLFFRVLTFYNISPDFSLLCRLQSSRMLLRKRILLFYGKYIGMSTLLLTSRCNFGYASCVGDLLFTSINKSMLPEDIDVNRALIITYVLAPINAMSSFLKVLCLDVCEYS